MDAIQIAKQAMKTWLLVNKFVLLITAVVISATAFVVAHVHIPGHIDVVAAQAMDMSQMRPPTGAAIVQLGRVRKGAISDTVTYTGTIEAYDEQNIAPRITGVVLSLPVYTGDEVHSGELLAQLDTSQAAPQARQAAASAQEARDAARVAELAHKLRSQDTLEQAQANAQAAQAGIAEAQAEALAAKQAIADAAAGVESATANINYWTKEIAREKTLVDAGAVSQQEYQSELAQSQSAQSALAQAQAKRSAAESSEVAAQAKTVQMRQQLRAARANVKMSHSEVAIAAGQSEQAKAAAASAGSAAQAASAVESYARITSPANGVVVSRPIAPGTLVQPGTTILKIAEIDKVRIQANVAVTDLAGIHPGTPVVITPQGAGDDKPFLAHVTSVFPAASDQTRTAVVEAVVPNPGHHMLPGGFVVMKIARAAYANKLLAPAESVIAQNGQNSVWLAQADTDKNTIYECVICHIHYSAKQAAKFGYKDPMDGGQLVPVSNKKAKDSAARLKAIEIPVTIGATNGKWTEIVSGALKPGDQVVTAGQAGLAAGDAIKVAANKR